MRRLRRVARIGAWLLSWPPTLLHELAHAVASEPVADEVRLVDPLTEPSCDADWADGASGWAIAFAAYAPTVSGLLLAVAALLAALVGGGLPLPESARDLLVIAVGAVWYGIFVVPSGGDYQTAAEGLARVQERATEEGDERS